ncbi:MAG: glycosyltransferase family 4 protein [Leptolyngbyaceae cyanobacterium]
MHVIVLEPFPFSRKGGQPLSTLEVSKGLSELGHTVSLIYFKHGDLLPEYRKFCHETIYIQEGRLQSKKVFKSLAKILFQLIHASSRLKLREKESLIYISDHQRSLFAVLLAFLKRSPAVIHLRTPATPLMTAHKQDRWPISKINHFIAISKSLKGNWCQHFQIPSENISVVPNGTDIERFKVHPSITLAKGELGINSECPTISYVGRLSPSKGISVLINAFNALLQSCDSEIKLLIAGLPSGFHTLREGKKYEDSIKQLVSDLKISEKVIFLGHLDEPLKLYQASDVTVLPSIYPEPFGRSIIESMACGVPVLASNIGGIPEILSGKFGELLFEANNSEDLAIKLEKTLNWRMENPTLGEQVREHVVNNFSSASTFTKVEISLKRALKT